MNKRFLQLASFLLLIGGQLLAQNNGKTYFLKFNMAKGQQFSYKMGMDMNIDQSVMGQDVHVNSRMGMYYRFSVVGDSAGWKKLESVFDRMVMHINANGQTVDLDTDSSAAEGSPAYAMGRAFKPLIGQKFYYTLNDKGEVGQVTGIQAIGDKMKGNMSEMGPSAAGLNQVFSEESFRQNIEASYKYYPKKPVAIGESWTATMTTSSNGMPIVTDATYTLVSVSDNTAVIKATGTLKMAEGAKIQGMTATMTGTFDGTTDFALTSGLALKGVVDMNTDMKIDAQGQTIPVKMVMKINTTGKQL